MHAARRDHPHFSFLLNEADLRLLTPTDLHDFPTVSHGLPRYPTLLEKITQANGDEKSIVGNSR